MINIIFLKIVIIPFNIGLYNLNHVQPNLSQLLHQVEWLMVQIGRIGQKTGENLKKTSQIAVEKTKESIKKRMT